jgi:O-methyltransferase involved in polyketide biosynthesis
VSASETISPTAHYTGYVWARNGLSHPEFETVEGRIMFESLQPMMAVGGLLGTGRLEAYLLARHRAIDALLERAIDPRGARQVIEVAAGLSPRGWRFTRRYGRELTYVETDLPGMAGRKRRALERIGSDPHRHWVRELDILQEGGLATVARDLDPRQGLAIVTEGLLPYLPTDAVKAIWRRFATTLSDFAAGVYISDIGLGSDQDARVRAFRVLLSMFVRGRVYTHFESPEEVVAALRGAGFATAAVQRAADVIGGSGSSNAVHDRSSSPADDRAANAPADPAANAVHDRAANAPADRAANAVHDRAANLAHDPAANALHDRAANLAHILEASSI